MARFSGAIYDGPPRGYSRSGSPKRYIAFHNTGNTAPPRGEASYAKNRTDDVSSHFYSDPSTVIQSLDTSLDAWHAGSGKGNREAIAIEITGGNGWTADYWRKAIDRLAPVLADICRVHGIPVKWAGPRDSGGFVTHDDMRRYWGGTDHTDPGPNFPRNYVVEAINRHLNPAPAPAIPSMIGDDMFVVKIKGNPVCWVSNGIVRRQLGRQSSLDALRSTGVKVVEVASMGDVDDAAGPVAR